MSFYLVCLSHQTFFEQCIITLITNNFIIIAHSCCSKLAGMYIFLCAGMLVTRSKLKGIIIYFQAAGSCNMPPLSLQLSHYIAMHHEVLTARFVLCTTCYSVNIWCKLQNISFTWSMRECPCWVLCRRPGYRSREMGFRVDLVKTYPQ